MIGHSLWLEIIQKMLYILWFSNNQVELNADKCYLHRNSRDLLCIKHFSCGKLLGINVDCQLNLEFHIEDICQKE